MIQNPDQATRISLPLYSTRSGIKYVPEKSGLNQWLAGGRSRAPGEVYFPIPSEVHKLAENFFPDQKQTFDLELPSGLITSGKVCQQGGKALMSSPNFHLSSWLFIKIDGSLSASVERYAKRLPYSYGDLEKLGFDSVILEKTENRYLLSAGTVGGYENWREARKLSLNF
jgi:hypothetical protein